MGVIFQTWLMEVRAPGVWHFAGSTHWNVPAIIRADGEVQNA